MKHKIITQNHFDDSLTQYGDGVFETMLAVGDAIHHWDYHWRRLHNSCQRLQIDVPERGLLEQQLQAELLEQDNDYSVIKMIVSRGAGLRGYRTHVEQPCYVQFRVSPYQFNPTLYQGLNLRICQTRLSHQPLLAGMKHTNRLEYVMARREPADTAFDEGLLLNYDGDLIEGLISNVFLIKDDEILTPDLSGSGVAGTMRAYLLGFLPTLGYSVGIKTLNLTHVEQADEVFLSNATSGVLPIRTVNGIKRIFKTTIADNIRCQMEHPCSK